MEEILRKMGKERERKNEEDIGERIERKKKVFANHEHGKKNL